MVSADNLQVLAGLARELASKREPAVQVPARVAGKKPVVPEKIAEAVEAPVVDEAGDDAAPSAELEAIFAAGERFHAEALKHLPAQHYQANASVGAEGLSACEGDYRARLQSITELAIGLPLLERSFSTAWPSTVRNVLPSNEERIPPEVVWLPVLAWIALVSFPDSCDRLALFDQLDLRAALAEGFSSIGLQGESAWRAAARVRILLMSGEDFWGSGRFWSDPDVRWLAGVNESSGDTFFNKECFEELLSWLQLPTLLALPAEDRRPLIELEKRMTALRSAAAKAGYKLEAFRRHFGSEKVESAS